MAPKNEVLTGVFTPPSFLVPWFIFGPPFITRQNPSSGTVERGGGGEVVTAGVCSRSPSNRPVYSSHKLECCDDCDPCTCKLLARRDRLTGLQQDTVRVLLASAR